MFAACTQQQPETGSHHGHQHFRFYNLGFEVEGSERAARPPAGGFKVQSGLRVEGLRRGWLGVGVRLSANREGRSSRCVGVIPNPTPISLRMVTGC